MIKQFLFWQPASFGFNLILFFFSQWFLWLVIFSLSFYWLIKRSFKQLGWFWFFLIVSEILETVIKHFSPWPRPFYQKGVTPPEWISHYSYGSFPSGHAIRSAIVLWFLWRENKRWFWLLLPGIILVNLGRILFSLHYPIDILGGLVLGYLLVKIEELKVKNLIKS